MKTDGFSRFVAAVMNGDPLAITGLVLLMLVLLVTVFVLRQISRTKVFFVLIVLCFGVIVLGVIAFPETTKNTFWVVAEWVLAKVENYTAGQ